MSAYPANPALVAAPGSLAALHGALKARMAVVAALFPLLETKDQGVTRAPTVGDGWLPPKPINGEQYPFLLVRPSDGVDTEQSADQNATANIDIVIGTYSDTDDGWIDVLLIIDAIRVDLATTPAIADTAFEQTGPSTWQIPEEQPRPQWLGVVKTKWTVPRPVRADGT